MANVRLYEDASHAKLYAKFRPTYPQNVFDTISSFSKKHGINLKTGVALDLACGSGQGTFPLADVAKKCIGVDISRAQIDSANNRKAAEEKDGVEFMIADAHSLPFEADYFDLVTCSTAWHWLDPKTACPEVSRVMKNPGCLAVYCYAPFVLHNPQCDQLFKDFYEKLATVWHPRTNLVKNYYRDVELPYPVTERHDISVGMTMTVSELVGFLQSLACYRALCEKYPNNSFLEDLAVALRNILSGDATTQNGSVEELSMEASAPICLLLCIKD